MKKHNGVISVWKFVFAIGILLHHLIYLDPEGKTLDHFRCSSIGVDFFFIVSGYLLAKKVASETRKNDTRSLAVSTRDFLLRKMKGIFPYLLFSYLIMLVIMLVCTDITAWNVLMSTFDINFLIVIINPSNNILGGVWFLSAMILAMLLIYPLQKKYGKTFSWIIAPLIYVFLGGYLFINYADVSLREWKSNIGYMHLGFAKAILEISLGCTVYEITEGFKKFRFTKFGQMLLTVAELASLGGVLFANLWYRDVRRYDPAFILLLAFGIMVAFSEQTFFYKICCNRLFFYLEKLSLAIYPNNYIFIRLCNRADTFHVLTKNEKFMVVIFGTIALSVIEIPVIAGLGKLRAKIAPYAKKLVLVSESEQ